MRSLDFELTNRDEKPPAPSIAETFDSMSSKTQQRQSWKWLAGWDSLGEDWNWLGEADTLTEV
jgi:hypothetical protein